MQRTILHVDLNNFFASVECTVNPELRDKPVAVCGSQSDRHGIVLAKNHIAKGYGVKTASAIWEAKSVCPNLVIVRPNYPLYLKYSKMARKIYEEYTEQIESFGIDECWMDVTGSRQLFGEGENIAWRIKERVKKELGITCSIGVSFNKIFAKLGSDMKKPDAITVIGPEDVAVKVFPLPCEELLYVGRATKRKLNNIAIYTIGDFASANPKLLERILGKWGRTLWYFANGLDTSSVHRIDYKTEIKSVGNSITTPKDMISEHDVKTVLLILSESVGQRLREHGLEGRTVQITIRDSNLNFIERQATLPFHTNVTIEIYKQALKIIKENWNWKINIRLLGVRALDLIMMGEFVQTSLFMDKRHEKLKRIDYCLDGIRNRFGPESVKRALIMKEDLLSYNHEQSFP